MVLNIENVSIFSLLFSVEYMSDAAISIYYLEEQKLNFYITFNFRSYFRNIRCLCRRAGRAESCGRGGPLSTALCFY